ncbi:hypothetical protein EJB05_40796, partial [Eragrostis curvula]
MEVFLSAVLGDLNTRAMSFFISRSCKPQAPDVEDHLRRVLLRAQVITDEAMLRHITNQAMLLQLHKMRDVMHRCYYMLDTVGYQSHDEEDIEGQLTPGAEVLEVLPIVGPGKVGKSTLVAHVCMQERVRDLFSEIVFLSDRDFTNDKLASFREGCGGKYQNPPLNTNKDGRLLFVIELVGNLSEDSWTRLYSAYKQYTPRGSKIILTSQSDNIIKFGTTGALILKYLPHEAYWYLFKTLTFGTMDPETHPRLVHLALEIARTLNSSLLSANLTAGLLRDKIDIPFWHKFLTTSREYIQKHHSKFGEHPFDLLHKDKPVQVRRMAQPSKDFVVHHQYQCSLDEEVPKIMMWDVMYGRVKQHGKFEALVWRSRIPPYHSFVNTWKIFDGSIQNSHDRVSQVTLLLKPYYNIVICKVAAP